MKNRAHGMELLSSPMLNKDTAFTEAEREALGLRGLLPSRVTTLEEQVDLELEHLHRKADDLEKYIGLAALQDRNERLFYRLLIDHLEELAPIVYTPTVGDACLQFSHVLRRPRGVWITPADIDAIPALLRGIGRDGIRLIVATDNERILGLGDQGAGGMGIPIGKLSLYVAGAGLHPALTLPVCLDVGTDNQALLDDPLYLGYQHPRLRGEAYDEFIEAFVQAVIEVFPDAVLQWEDFKQHNAIRLLDRYRHRLASFNDDVQGTAAVVAAGVLAAVRHRGELLADQRIVFVGAGAAGIGIARLLAAMMRAEGAPDADVRRSLVMLDSRGLVYDGRADVADDKRPFALPEKDLLDYGLGLVDSHDLESVVRRVEPTVLIGTSGTTGAFTEGAIRAMAERTGTPIVLPLSNPTSRAEAVPADVLRWSAGRALVATGSPFDPVDVDGQERIVGQANNVFIFPGVGLGALVAEARELTDDAFLTAADELAASVSPARLAAGGIFPPIPELRPIARRIAIAVVRRLRDTGYGRQFRDEEIEPAVDGAMWTPAYRPYRRA
jgi:malic enzyme